jgi:hypothetical protein
MKLKRLVNSGRGKKWIYRQKCWGGGRKGGEAMLAFIAKIKISTMFLQKSEIIQQNLHYCSFHEVPVTTGTCPKQIRTV